MVVPRMFKDEKEKSCVLLRMSKEKTEKKSDLRNKNYTLKALIENQKNFTNPIGDKIS